MYRFIHSLHTPVKTLIGLYLALGCLVVSVAPASADIMGTSITVGGITGATVIPNQPFTVTASQEIACPNVALSICNIAGLVGVNFVSPDIIAFAFTPGTLITPTILLFSDIDSPPLGQLLGATLQSATANVSSFDNSDINVTDVSGAIPGLDRVGVNLSGVVISDTLPVGVIRLELDFADVAAVPEPATLVLMGSALVGLLVSQRYRAKASRG